MRIKSEERQTLGAILRVGVCPMLVALFVTGCGGSSATSFTPTAPSVPACQSNNTASVSFGNRSRATTHDIFWDGLKVATLTPGSDSSPITAAAGVAHRLEARLTNTNTPACAVSSPIPAACSSPVYTCAFP